MHMRQIASEACGFTPQNARVWGSAWPGNFPDLPPRILARSGDAQISAEVSSQCQLKQSILRARFGNSGSPSSRPTAHALNRSPCMRISTPEGRRIWRLGKIGKFGNSGNPENSENPEIGKIRKFGKFGKSGNRENPEIGKIRKFGKSGNLENPEIWKIRKFGKSGKSGNLENSENLENLEIGKIRKSGKSEKRRRSKKFGG